ncbi:MAG: glycosyltransferase [Candidatus Bathyarchaeia archaeon]
MLTKLAVLHHALGRFGGGEKLAILHSINLKRMGFDVELFYGGPIIEDWRRRAASEVRLRNLPFAISNSSPNLDKLFRIARYLESCDIILFHHHVDPLSAFLLSHLTKKRIGWYCGEPLRALWEDWLSGNSYRALGASVKATSIESYGRTVTKIFLSSALYGMTVNFLRSVDMATVTRFEKVIANSYYTREVVSKLYPLDSVIPVVHPGVDLNFNSNHQLDPGPKRNDPMILSVGAMIPMKNYPNMIRAFSLLRKDFMSSLKLVIVGDGPERRSIK